MNANKYSILKEDSRLQHKLESKSINPPETTENIAKRPNYNILLGTTPLKPKQMPRAWRTFVIAMDQDSQRFRSFEKNNSHLDFEVFNAVNGKNLNFKELVSNGLVTEELSTSPLLTKGRAGCAESHRSLWRKSVNENISLLILEDDCYTHPGIEPFINARLQTLSSIDICLFGVNTDVAFHSISPQGLASITIFMPKYPREEWIKNALQRTKPTAVTFHKLLRGAGFCTYFITPKGASKMLAQIFPLSLEERDPYRTILPFSTDRSASKVYRDIAAAVCQPFMAYTPNTDSSTVMRPNKNIQ